MANTYTTEQLAEILSLHVKWLRGEAAGTRAVLRDAVLTDANLRGAVLTRAVLTRAVLTDAVLTDANLRGAVLTDAVLTDANLRGANLRGADLRDADLTGAVLTDAETFEAYLSTVVPALLTAGGKALDSFAPHWKCNTWDNCPIAHAFDCHDIDGVPLLLRPRAEQFIQLFDAGLIPLPVAGA